MIIEKCFYLFIAILSIVNGTYILINHLKDKPIIIIDFIYPNEYQWWFEKKSINNREDKYGFLLYISLGNKGLRATTIKNFIIEIKLKNNKKIKLNPLSIPEPLYSQKLEDGSAFKKTYTALGINGNPTKIKSGSIINGFAYYNKEINDGLIIKKNQKIKVKFVLIDVFGKKWKKVVMLNKKNINFVKKFIKPIEYI